MRKKHKKKSKLKKIYIALSVVLLLFILSIVHVNSIVKSGKILKNVTVHGVDLSNRTRDEARKMLTEKFKFGKLILKNGDNQFETELVERGFEYDIDKAVQEAYNIGRSKNFFGNIFDTIGINQGKSVDIPLDYTKDYDNLGEWLNAVSSEVITQPSNPTVSVSNGEVNIISGKKGKKLDVPKLLDIIKEKIDTSFGSQDITVDMPIVEVEPYIKEKQLYSIDGVIAQYSTKYPTSDVARAFNVTVAAKKTDGQLLMPGDEISFMNYLGSVNEEAGFKPATIIINNEYVDGIGGGVCQVSSTMYNAIIRSGMTILSRSNHTFPIGYVPLGLDATVADPLPDLKYRNDNPFPVYIKNSAGGGYMTTTIYGNKAQAKKIEITTEIKETTPPEVKYKNDPTLPKGKEKIDDKGHTGYKVTSYKIVNGEKTVLANSTYTMTPQIILTGTGEEAVVGENGADMNAQPEQPVQTQQAPLF